MPYLSVLGSNFEKPFSYLQSVPSNLSYCKVWCEKQKPKMQDFLILWLNFENTIVIFEITVLKFILSLSLVQK